MDQSIVNSARDFAISRLSADLPSYIKYHDLFHTETVVSGVLNIGQGEGLSDNELQLLEVAAWFHDLGYLDRVEGHESLSAEMVDEFLREKGFDNKAEIEIIKGLIRSTEMGFSATSKLEMIIQDADMAHLGLVGAIERSQLLKEEKEDITGEKIGEKEWIQTNLEFYSNHEYHTETARKEFGPSKAEHLKLMEKNLANLNGGSEAPKKKDGGKKKKKEKKGKKDKVERKGRGVETMFRVTLKNHMALSQIADNKANIMLSINAIIVSIVLTSLFPKLDNNAFLIWPSVLLLAVCIASIIFATISTIPKVTTGLSSLQAIRERKVNLLFFGNFYNLKLDDYIFGMQDLMEDDDYLYETLMKDLYFLGKVLNKKYKHLRICYSVFMVGIILSVLAYLLAFALMFESI